MSGDPFDDIDTDPDDEGDPFSELADEIPDEESSEATQDEAPLPPEENPMPDADDQMPDDLGFDTPDGDQSSPSEGDHAAGPGIPDASGDDRLEDDPFGDTGDGPSTGPDGETDRQIDPDGDPFADLASEAGDAVDDELWEDLSVDPDAPSVSEQQGPRRFSEVSKHRFCEQCPHFTGPPDIACTHEGTDIVEFVDMETVRVADCPIVEERERLQNQ